MIDAVALRVDQAALGHVDDRAVHRRRRACRSASGSSPPLRVPLDDRRRDSQVGDRLTLALAGVGTSLTLLLGHRRPAHHPGVPLQHDPGHVRGGAVARPRARWPRRVVLAAGGVVVSVVMVAAHHGARRRCPVGVAVPRSTSALPGTPRVLVGAVVLAVLYTLVGLAVGAIVRSQPLAIVLIVIVAAAHRGDRRRRSSPASASGCRSCRGQPGWRSTRTARRPQPVGRRGLPGRRDRGAARSLRHRPARRDATR